MEELKANEKELAEKVAQMVPNLPTKYRDRAKERRIGANPDYAEDEVLLQRLQSTGGSNPLYTPPTLLT